MKNEIVKYCLALLFATLFLMPAQAQNNENKWFDLKTSGTLKYSYQIANATGYDMLVLKVENKTASAISKTFDIVVTDVQSNTTLYKHENIEVTVDPFTVLTGDPLEGTNPELIVWDSLDNKTVKVQIIEKS